MSPFFKTVEYEVNPKRIPFITRYVNHQTVLYVAYITITKVYVCMYRVGHLLVRF